MRRGAHSIYLWLTQRGYDVFIDYENIASGAFASVIDENILARAHFLVILSPMALDRCDEPRDWLRHEIETAMKHGRNIVPFMVDGFSFREQTVKSKLTGLLAHLPEYNGLEVAPGTFQDKMQRLSDHFLAIALSDVVHPSGVKAVQLDASLHPASQQAMRIAREQQAKASAVPNVQTRVVPHPWAIWRRNSLWLKLVGTLGVSVAVILALLLTRFGAPSPQPVSAGRGKPEPSREHISFAAGPQLMLVRTRTAHGVGFFFSADGLFVTVRHLVPEGAAPLIEVAPRGTARWRRAVVVKRHPVLDLALLKVEPDEWTRAAQFTEDVPKLGERLGVSQPFNMAEPIYVSGPLLTNTEPAYTIEARPALPGAPVFNSSGGVVGMVITAPVGSMSSAVLPSRMIREFALRVSESR